MDIQDEMKQLAERLTTVLNTALHETRTDSGLNADDIRSKLDDCMMERMASLPDMPPELVKQNADEMLTFFCVEMDEYETGLIVNMNFDDPLDHA